MKIGILTYHRSHNYGALLQAVATRVVLQNMGHEVYYVDYWPDYHKRMYQLFSFFKFIRLGWKHKLKYLYHFFKFYFVKKERFTNFQSFIAKYIVPFCKSEKESFDVIVYGSDQIWRKQFESKQFNPVYFGVNNFKANKHISYAASMGILASDEYDKNNLKALLSHLDKISVREQSLKHLILNIGFSNVDCVLDPTLLLTSNQWDMLIPEYNINIKTGYVLLYELQSGTFDETAVRLFANSNGLEFIKITGSANKKSSFNERTTAGPLEFVSLIRNASYVFTSSFHGLAFSIIYKKQFYCSFSKNTERAQSLLDIIGLGFRMKLPKTSFFDGISINYCDVVTRLNNNKQNSISILLDYISC